MIFDKVMNIALRFTGITAGFTGMYLGFQEDYAHAAFIVGLGIFSMLLAKESA